MPRRRELDPPTAVGRLLSDELDARGWTRQNLADRSHISKPHINSLVMKDHRDFFKTDKVRALCRALAIPEPRFVGAMLDSIGLAYPPPRTATDPTEETIRDIVLSADITHDIQQRIIDRYIRRWRASYGQTQRQLIDDLADVIDDVTNE